jgi:hypothetical protein
MEGHRRKVSIKMLYLLRIVLEICYYEKRHINAIRCLCHRNIFQGDKVTFFAHIFIALKDFIFDNLCLGLFVSQMMAKHRKNVHELVATSKNLTRDTFLCE